MRHFRHFQRRARFVALVMLLLGLSGLSGGCGRDREEEFLFAPDSPPVTLTYVGPGNSIFNEPEQVAIERFQELAPSIQIDRKSYGFNAGNYLLDTPPPDVMLMWDGNELRSAAALGLLSDVSDVWTEGNFTEAYGRRFRDMSRFDGTLRFVPAGFNWTGIYYNKEIFEQFGFTPPATWEEFELICDTLLANGITPMSLAGQNPFVSLLWFDYLNLRLNGPEFHRDLIAGQVDFNDVRIAQVWAFWKSLLDRGYFVESPGSTSEMSSMTALIRGDGDSPLSWEKAVMALAPQFSLGDLPPVFAEELDFFQFPRIDPNLPIGEVSVVFGYVIPADAQYRAEAGAFVGFMGSAEAHELQIARIGEAETNIGYVPVHRELDRELLSAAAEKGDQVVTGADQINPPLFLVLPDSMRASFNQVLRRLFLATSTSLEVAEIQTLLEEGRQRAVQNGEFPQ
ncbi:MAG: extracellular solute-binding protein [Caldilineaceae bacterium SB0661_bin_32]|uniref:Extracellular solute-binding protein n=1 Tax=Caldilineaceae bacterium SB0661_bin_32 TaxID=2605255 RepID=A0A6B1D7S4_9CHLR|nr:extracellular solute-binding protein [Caldilineaceae bacterium SB0661_bin_32]